MTETEFCAYFEAIAQNLIAISDNPAIPLRRFARAQEVLNGLKAGIDAKTTMLLVVGNEQGNIESIGTGNLVETHNCFFALLRQCREGAFDDYKTAYDDTLIAARKIIGKMAKDKKEGHPLMISLRLDNIQFNKVETKYDFCHGYEVYFNISEKNACDYKFNPADWL